MPWRRRLFLLLYAASGAAALVYEIAWTRLLTLQIGHTVAAVSTVLAAFMGGLALGSWLGGRFDAAVPRRSSSPAVIRLRAYAACEAAIGIIAIVLPAMLAAFVPLLAWAYHDGLTPATFGAVRVVLAVALLAVPATAMGATFPIAVSWFAGGTADAGQLYAANTAGAAVGALATGFWLIPSIGLRGTTWFGVGLNVTAACGALWLASRSTTSESEAGDRDADTRSAGLSGPRAAGREAARAKSRPRTRRALPSIAASPPMPRIATAAAAISGCVALVYEIAWTRLLVLVIGPTTYAFTTVVASFIFGLAIGAAAGARVAHRSSQPAAWLGVMLVVTALGASVAGWFAASRLPLVVAAQVANPDAAFAGVVTRQAIGIGLLLLPMTCALGAAFPGARGSIGHRRHWGSAQRRARCRARDA
jgi:spermidine synthase